MTRVLVIDDNDDFRKLALRWFQIHGIEAEGASNGATGLEIQRARPATVIVTDIFMPEKDGIETIRELLHEFPKAKIIVVTGHESLTDYDAFTRELGAAKTFKKPWRTLACSSRSQRHGLNLAYGHQPRKRGCGKRCSILWGFPRLPCRRRSSTQCG